MRRHLAPLLAVMLGWAASGPALALDDADHTAGRTAIAGQIDAFRHDDGPGAFAYAAPAIRDMFGSDNAFMAMVRNAYRPVYRPRRFDFGAVRDLGDGFEQAVELQDEAGVDWDAIYTFERQPDGSWKISGCRLVKKPGESV